MTATRSSWTSLLFAAARALTSGNYFQKAVAMRLGVTSGDMLQKLDELEGSASLYSGAATATAASKIGRAKLRTLLNFSQTRPPLRRLDIYGRPGVRSAHGSFRHLRALSITVTHIAVQLVYTHNRALLKLVFVGHEAHRRPK